MFGIFLPPLCRSHRNMDCYLWSRCELLCRKDNYKRREGPYQTESIVQYAWKLQQGGGCVEVNSRRHILGNATNGNHPGGRYFGKTLVGYLPLSLAINRFSCTLAWDTDAETGGSSTGEQNQVLREQFLDNSNSKTWKYAVVLDYNSSNSWILVPNNNFTELVHYR